MKFIAKGRFGQCYAITLPSKQIVVTKLVLLQGKKRRALARQEAQIHARLQHPSVCQYLKSFWTKAHLFLVLEYCNDGTLWDAAKKGVYHCEWTTQLLDGVVYLHSCGILHRDLKLSNLLVKKQHIKISDFGFAVEGPLAQGMYGTPNYLAPEILHHATYSYAVDVWALGCCFYALRHRGCGPFQRETMDDTYTAIKSLDRPADLDPLEASMLVPEHERPLASEIIRTWCALQPSCR